VLPETAITNALDNLIKGKSVSITNAPLPQGSRAWAISGNGQPSPAAARRFNVSRTVDDATPAGARSR
jgi:hypothetical protein